jgi:hypothetical protein
MWTVSLIHHFKGQFEVLEKCKQRAVTHSGSLNSDCDENIRVFWTKCERRFYNHKGKNWIQRGAALFWVITQGVVIIAYRRSGQLIGAIFREEPLKVEPTGSQERSVRNYHCSLRNNPEERSSHLLSCGNLKSRWN